MLEDDIISQVHTIETGMKRFLFTSLEWDECPLIVLVSHCGRTRGMKYTQTKVNSTWYSILLVWSVCLTSLWPHFNARKQTKTKIQKLVLFSKLPNAMLNVMMFSFCVIFPLQISSRLFIKCFCVCCLFMFGLPVRKINIYWWALVTSISLQMSYFSLKWAQTSGWPTSFCFLFQIIMLLSLTLVGLKFFRTCLQNNCNNNLNITFAKKVRGIPNEIVTCKCHFRFPNLAHLNLCIWIASCLIFWKIFSEERLCSSN